MDHDIVITEPGEITVDFYTINAHVPYETDGNGRDVTTVTYKNGLLREGTGDHTLLPVHAGSETVDVVTKLNDKKVLSSSTHTVFVAQSAVVPETDEEIGRMPAESFEGHTYQLFYSMRSWEDAEAFCEAHGGHLVTINTAAEQRFLEKYLDAVEVRASYWIGLNSGKATKFTSWITGEPLDFTKWAPGNPDRKKPESCGRIAAKSYQDHIGWTMGRGNWDDESKNYSHIAGFICEWEEENSAKALPAK